MARNIQDMDFLQGLSPYLAPRTEDPLVAMQGRSPMMTPDQALLLQKLSGGAEEPAAPAPQPNVKMTAQGPMVQVPEPGDGQPKPGRGMSLEDEYRDLRAKLDEKVSASLANQQAGIGQLENSLKEMKARPRGIDFSALTSYFDSIVPDSKLSQGYTPPESEEKRQERILQLEGAIQKSKEGMSDKEIDYMKSLLNTNLTNKALQQQGRNSRFEESQLLKKEDTLRKDLTKVSDDLAEDQQKLSTLEINLGSGDYQKVANSLSNFSRAVSGEKGVLTDSDIARVLPKNFQGSLARFAAYFSETPSAQIDPAYTKALVELTQTAKQKTAEKYRQQIGQRRKAYGAPTSVYRDVMAGPGGIMFDELEKAAGGLGTISAPAAPATDKRARLEELRKKAAGG